MSPVQCNFLNDCPMSNSIGGESPACNTCVLLDTGTFPVVGNGTRNTAAIDQSSDLCSGQQCVGSQ